jgi:FkbH-like protein
VFREHDEMILREEHIACFCVNWDNKADNIKAISETLNIGLDSIVFIDDSDFEVQAVKALLPEVTVVKYERDSVYGGLSCFNLKNDIDIEKVQKRNFTYQTNELRKNLKAESSSFEEYLNALEMTVDIHKALPIELSRIAELTQRTNKCTNGKRYTAQQIKDKLSNGYELYSVSLADKFSYLGLVGAIGIDGNTLDLFSLSCRALGRNVEEIMISFIREKNIKKSYYNLTVQNNELHSKINNLLNQ